MRLRVPDESGGVRELLLRESEKLSLPIVATGMSSVRQYAVMQQADLLSVYCPRLESLMGSLAATEDDRFPNLELVETEDETVYFDARQAGDFWWASPLQAYLELMAGDKRDQETAEQVASHLLSEFGSNQQ